MNRRTFNKAMFGALATGFCAGIGAATFSPAPRQASGNRNLSDLCLSPTYRSRLEPVSGSWPKHLTMTGTRLLKNAFLDEISSLIRQTAGQKVVVQGGGCDDGIQAVLARRAHMGSVCCPIPGSPARDMYWLPIAMDLKVVLTHPSNPVEGISMGALRDVARGRIRNWKQIGGEEKPIALVVSDHCPTYSEPVRTLLLDGREPWSGHRLSANTDDDHLRQVARFSSSIGINSWILAEPFVLRGELKLLDVDGISATVEAAGRGDYPLMGPLNLIFSHWHDGEMRSFFDHVYGDQGQAIIRQRTVPVSKEKALQEGRAPQYARHV